MAGLRITQVGRRMNKIRCGSCLCMSVCVYICLSLTAGEASQVGLWVAINWSRTQLSSKQHIAQLLPFPLASGPIFIPTHWTNAYAVTCFLRLSVLVVSERKGKRRKMKLTMDHTEFMMNQTDRTHNTMSTPTRTFEWRATWLSFHLSGQWLSDYLSLLSLLLLDPWQD